MIKTFWLLSAIIMSHIISKSSAFKCVSVSILKRRESSIAEGVTNHITALPTKRAYNMRMLAVEENPAKLDNGNNSPPSSSSSSSKSKSSSEDKKARDSGLIKKLQERKAFTKANTSLKPPASKAAPSSVSNKVESPKKETSSNPYVVKPVIPAALANSNMNSVKVTPTANRPPLIINKPYYIDEEVAKDRPFTLPPGEFRPKQSLGQNYLSDQNYVRKIIDAFQLQRSEYIKTKAMPSLQAEGNSAEVLLALQEAYKQGQEVVEIGPGAGALTRTLLPIYPKMTAIEIDQRAVELLSQKLPALHVIHQDILTFDWRDHYARQTQRQRINIIANLPYYIVSQVLFTLADSYEVINLATVTMQWELAERMVAKRNTKDYGIPSVVFQLYGDTHIHFKIPPNVFFPVPKVDSALISFDFSKPHPDLFRVDQHRFRKVVSTAFRQRRKMMRQSLKELLLEDQLELPLRWSTRRPEDLEPVEFLELTADLYGEMQPKSELLLPTPHEIVWRRGKAKVFTPEQ